MQSDFIHTLSSGPIGVFDSGFGGLTILREMRKLLPQYDYMFLGDNARAPYGSHSFDVVYDYTRQCVEYLFSMGCPLVILACNTASAKALRTIQMNDLPSWNPDKRVLGIIRPTAEHVSEYTRTGHVGLFATTGTVTSQSYPIELSKINQGIVVSSVACPMWVPLVENGEYDNEGADYFVRKKVDELISMDNKIDSVILGCTHYPILIEKIRKYLPQSVQIISQGEIVAQSLQDYLSRHTDLDAFLTKNGNCEFLTTESEEKFRHAAQVFLNNSEITARKVVI